MSESRKDDFITYQVIIAGKKIVDAKKLTSGGSKTIIDLGDGSVIAAIFQHDGQLDHYVDAEVAFSAKLRKLGLRAQAYEKAIVEINGCVQPVLKMPSFQTLCLQGQQVRDYKNHESHVGNTLIFGCIDNARSADHWRKITSCIAHEIVIYFINNLRFGFESFNLIIEDTSNTSTARAHTSSFLFSDLEQEIHLYFYDFSDKGEPYIEQNHYEFTDLNGEILEQKIFNYVNVLCDLVRSAIFSGVKHDELSRVTGESDILIAARILQLESEAAFLTVKNEIVPFVVSGITTHLKSLTPNERLTRYATPQMHRLIEMNSDHRENMLKRQEEIDMYRQEQAAFLQDFHMHHLKVQAMEAEIERIRAEKAEDLKRFYEKDANSDEVVTRQTGCSIM